MTAPVTNWIIGVPTGGVDATAPFTDGTFFADADGSLWGWEGDEGEPSADGPTTVWTIDHAAGVEA